MRFSNFDAGQPMAANSTFFPISENAGKLLFGSELFAFPLMNETEALPKISVKKFELNFRPSTRNCRSNTSTASTRF